MRNLKAAIHDFNDFVTSPGDKFHVLYDSHLNADGTIRLTESSREDIQKKINSHLIETDMSIIIAKLQSGDMSALTSQKPMYGDFTVFPKTYAEALDLVTRSEKAFESLDVNIKQKFDNSRDKWFTSIGSAEWYENMGLVDSSTAEVIVPVPESEVK